MADEIQNAQVVSSNTLTGKNVVNDKGEDIGSIKDLMIDMDYGQVAYAVLQFGGFMGLGEKLFAIPLEALTWDTQSDTFILNVDKDTLENAEGFDEDNWPDMANYRFMQQTYDHYGFEPYWL